GELRLLDTVSGGLTILSGNNVYSGGTEIADAQARVMHNNALGTGTVELDEGVIQAGATGLTLANAIALAAGPDAGGIDNNGFTFTLSGVIADESLGVPGSLTVAGAGTTVLSNNNTYTGNTTVQSGTLMVDGSI